MNPIENIINSLESKNKEINLIALKTVFQKIKNNILKINEIINNYFYLISSLCVWINQNQKITNEEQIKMVLFIFHKISFCKEGADLLIKYGIIEFLQEFYDNKIKNNFINLTDILNQIMKNLIEYQSNSIINKEIKHKITTLKEPNNNEVKEEEKIKKEDNKIYENNYNKHFNKMQNFINPTSLSNILKNKFNNEIIFLPQIKFLEEDKKYFFEIISQLKHGNEDVQMFILKSILPQSIIDYPLEIFFEYEEIIEILVLLTNKYNDNKYKYLLNIFELILKKLLNVLNSLDIKNNQLLDKDLFNDNNNLPKNIFWSYPNYDKNLFTNINHEKLIKERVYKYTFINIFDFCIKSLINMTYCDFSKNKSFYLLKNLSVKIINKLFNFDKNNSNKLIISIIEYLIYLFNKNSYCNLLINILYDLMGLYSDEFSKLNCIKNFNKFLMYSILNYDIDENNYKLLLKIKDQTNSEFRENFENIFFNLNQIIYLKSFEFNNIKLINNNEDIINNLNSFIFLIEEIDQFLLVIYKSNNYNLINLSLKIFAISNFIIKNQKLFNLDNNYNVKIKDFINKFLYLIESFNKEKINILINNINDLLDLENNILFENEFNICLSLELCNLLNKDNIILKIFFYCIEIKEVKLSLDLLYKFNQFYKFNLKEIIEFIPILTLLKENNYDKANIILQSFSKNYKKINKLENLVNLFSLNKLNRINNFEKIWKYFELKEDKLDIMNEMIDNNNKLLKIKNNEIYVELFEKNVKITEKEVKSLNEWIIMSGNTILEKNIIISSLTQILEYIIFYRNYPEIKENVSLILNKILENIKEENLNYEFFNIYLQIMSFCLKNYNYLNFSYKINYIFEIIKNDNILKNIITNLTSKNINHRLETLNFLHLILFKINIDENNWNNNNQNKIRKNELKFINHYNCYYWNFSQLNSFEFISNTKFNDLLENKEFYNFVKIFNKYINDNNNFKNSDSQNFPKILNKIRIEKIKNNITNIITNNFDKIKKSKGKDIDYLNEFLILIENMVNYNCFIYWGDDYNQLLINILYSNLENNKNIIDHLNFILKFIITYKLKNDVFNNFFKKIESFIEFNIIPLLLELDELYYEQNIKKINSFLNIIYSFFKIKSSNLLLKESLIKKLYEIFEKITVKSIKNIIINIMFLVSKKLKFTDLNYNEIKNLVKYIFDIFTITFYSTEELSFVNSNLKEIFLKILINWNKFYLIDSKLINNEIIFSKIVENSFNRVLNIRILSYNCTLIFLNKENFKFNLTLFDRCMENIKNLYECKSILSYNLNIIGKIIDFLKYKDNDESIEYITNYIKKDNFLLKFNKVIFNKNKLNYILITNLFNLFYKLIKIDNKYIEIIIESNLIINILKNFEPKIKINNNNKPLLFLYSFSNLILAMLGINQNVISYILKNDIIILKIFKLLNLFDYELFKIEENQLLMNKVLKLINILLELNIKGMLFCFNQNKIEIIKTIKNLMENIDNNEIKEEMKINILAILSILIKNWEISYKNLEEDLNYKKIENCFNSSLILIKNFNFSLRKNKYINEKECSIFLIISSFVSIFLLKINNSKLIFLKTSFFNWIKEIVFKIVKNNLIDENNNEIIVNFLKQMKYFFYFIKHDNNLKVESKQYLEKIYKLIKDIFNINNNDFNKLIYEIFINWHLNEDMSYFLYQKIIENNYFLSKNFNEIINQSDFIDNKIYDLIDYLMNLIERKEIRNMIYKTKLISKIMKFFKDFKLKENKKIYKKIKLNKEINKLVEFICLNSFYKESHNKILENSDYFKYILEIFENNNKTKKEDNLFYNFLYLLCNTCILKSLKSIFLKDSTLIITLKNILFDFEYSYKTKAIVSQFFINLLYKYTQGIIFVEKEELKNITKVVYNEILTEIDKDLKDDKFYLNILKNNLKLLNNLLNY